jgi:hypothetical protein
MTIDQGRIIHTLQRQNAENLKQIFPEKEYRGLSPNFHIHVSVSELYITTMGLPVLLEEICRLILGIYSINRSKTHECGNGAEAALFPEKEDINGIAVAVHYSVGAGQNLSRNFVCQTNSLTDKQTI